MISYAVPFGLWNNALIDSGIIFCCATQALKNETSRAFSSKGKSPSESPHELSQDFDWVFL